MKWTGLTGGIATGKSTAKKLFEGLGFPVIDADQISHKLSEAGQPGYLGIVSHFGNSILAPDQSLDRKKLGQIIFSDAQKKLELEQILHPLIKREVQILRSNYEKQGDQVCIYDVPLLFEKNLSGEFDVVIMIWCDAHTQLDRLVKRSGFSEADAQMRIKNQVPLVEKLARSNYCIDNSGSIHELELQIRKLTKKL